MKIFATLLLLTVITTFYGQVLPPTRSVDWKLTGATDVDTAGFAWYNALDFGFMNDGITANDVSLSGFLNSHTEPLMLYFPAGTYLFNSTISLRSYLILKGEGATTTTLRIDHNGSGHGISGTGFPIPSDTASLASDFLKDASSFQVSNSTAFASGDWIHLNMDDTDLVTSSWAIGSVGQIMRIDSIVGNNIYTNQAARLDFPLIRNPRIKRISPMQNIGLECLSIDRIDNCAPEQASNICFDYAVHCWVNGIESNQTTFAHLEASHSSNISITNSYFHDAFDYGGGGRAYGVMLHFSTNRCFVYGNIFDHLRHAMIVQAGANGNVFCYNRSVDPFWTGSIFLPSNSAGDMVLHGNYVFANLFEQNDGQNMVIDNSHGANGPNNTFFRNRGSLFGIFFSDNTSPGQNFIGNEIPNTTLPYSSVNYNILGNNHFVFGNNNKGTIDPAGTENLPDSSYCFTEKPTEMFSFHWSSIGTPNALNSGEIPATYYFDNNQLFANSCGYTTDLSVPIKFSHKAFTAYPNPTSSSITITCEIPGEKKLYLTDISGRMVVATDVKTFPILLPLDGLADGCYHIHIQDAHTHLQENVIIRK